MPKTKRRAKPDEINEPRNFFHARSTQSNVFVWLDYETPKEVKRLRG